MSDYEEKADDNMTAYDKIDRLDPRSRLEGGIKSSGERRGFGTGAHRDSNTAEHKGRMDLIPACALHRFVAFLSSFDLNPHDKGPLHALACYAEAMESMYLWLEGERSQEFDNGHYIFDHLSNVLLQCQNIMHMNEDIPLWCPDTQDMYKEAFGLRYDRISPLLLKRVSIHYQLGGINYGDRNWEKGMPAMVTWDSAARHLRNWLEKEETEDHMAAVAWNIMCTMHTIQMVQIGLLPDELYAPPMHRNIKTAVPLEDLDLLGRIKGGEDG